MSPINNFYLFLIIVGILFGVYWFRRQYKNARENFNTLATLIDSPQIEHSFLIIYINGNYQGRKVGWSYSALFGYNSHADIRLYIEPNCKIKKNRVNRLFDNCWITENTKLRNNRIYFIRSPLKDMITGILQDMMPLFTREEISGFLEEINNAAGIVEARDPKSFSIPIKEQLFNIVAIIVAIIFMFIMVKVFISEALSKIH